MSTEIEAKMRVRDPEVIREHLRANGARYIGRVLERNRMFDTADARLRLAGCGLRIRAREPLDVVDSGGAQGTSVLTYKGPRSVLLANTGRALAKSREELETLVADATILIAIFERLGWREVVYYEKRRESWGLGSSSVELDELPGLGWWAEIEGPDAAAVDAVRAQLGLAGVPVTLDSYVAMAAAHGQPDAAGSCRLCFPD